MRQVVGYISVSLLIIFASACLMFYAAMWNAEQLKQNGECKILIHEFICSK
jgi:hypothetical protein